MSFLYHHPEKGARTQIHSLVSPPGSKYQQLVRQVGVLRVTIDFHLFLDGHSRLTDPALHGDLVWEP